MATIHQTRRKFLTTIGALLAVACAGKFLRPRLKVRKRLLSLTKKDVPLNGALVYKESQVAVIQDSDARFYALSLVCTHLGCSVTVTPTDFVCPCHGSRFDRQGNVLSGPADRPLPRYAVEVEGDRIHVFV